MRERDTSFLHPLTFFAQRRRIHDLAKQPTGIIPVDKQTPEYIQVANALCHTIDEQLYLSQYLDALYTQLTLTPIEHGLWRMDHAYKEFSQVDRMQQRYYQYLLLGHALSRIHSSGKVEEPSFLETIFIGRILPAESNGSTNRNFFPLNPDTLDAGARTDALYALYFQGQEPSLIQTRDLQALPADIKLSRRREQINPLLMLQEKQALITKQLQPGETSWADKTFPAFWSTVHTFIADHAPDTHSRLPHVYPRERFSSKA